jgi:hypothetical protein
MNFIINDEIKTSKCGIYKIQFDDGRFYIGSSVNLYARVVSHCADMKNGFKINVSLKKMNGYNGNVVFSVLQPVDFTKESRYSSVAFLLKIEYEHIKAHSLNQLLLNNPCYGVGYKSISGLVDIEIKKAIKTMALERNVSVNALVGHILTSYVRQTEDKLSSLYCS